MSNRLHRLVHLPPGTNLGLGNEAWGEAFEKVGQIDCQKHGGPVSIDVPDGGDCSISGCCEESLDEAEVVLAGTRFSQALMDRIIHVRDRLIEFRKRTEETLYLSPEAFAGGAMPVHRRIPPLPDDLSKEFVAVREAIRREWDADEGIYDFSIFGSAGTEDLRRLARRLTIIHQIGSQGRTDEPKM